MAFTHGKNTKVLVGGYDLTSYFRESSMSSQIDMAETSVYGASNKTYIQGLSDATISVSGLFDSTAVTGPDAVLNSLLGSTANTPITVAFEGTAIGKRLWGISAQESSYEVTSSVGDVSMISAEFATSESSGKSGVSLHAHTAAENQTGAAVNSASVDNTASTAVGAIALLHVTAISGAPAATIRVEHSSDNSTFATLGTFASTVTAANTSQTLAIASGTTINRYVRASATGTNATSVTYALSFIRL